MIKTDPIVLKKNKRIEHVLKNVGTICKGTERNGTEITQKERLKSGMRSYYQERVLSSTHLKSGMCSKSSRNN